MRASIVICTHSRAEMLKRALGALLQVRDELLDSEVLVVDNASTDDTRAVCERFREDGLPLVYVHEPVLGLSSARNRGIVESHGDVLLFLDDDALVGPGWLAELLAVFEDATVGAAGGRVLLEYVDGRPGWLSDYAELYLTKVDWPGDTRDIDLSREWIAGANMAFRRAALANDAFSVHLGRKGSDLLSGEETQLLGELAEKGWKVRYVPNATVRHLIPGSRVTREYVLARARAAGRSSALMRRTDARGGTFGFVFSALRSLAAGIVRRGIATDSQQRLDAEMLVVQAGAAIRYVGVGRHE